MREKRRYKIPLKYKNQIKSLCWVDDYLIDFVGGHQKFYLNGESEDRSINYAYRFDSAISAGDGNFSVIYERYGTKGLILKEKKLVREINRSFYCADSYQYPVVMFTQNDKTYIAHCPDEYNIIEIEELETGRRITRADREPVDFFQSRLQVSPNHRWLLSAGWVWHPWDSIQLFDLSENLSDPERHDLVWKNNLGDVGLSEIHNAAFLDNEHLLMSGETDDDSVPEDEEPRNAVVLFNFIKKEIVSKAVTGEPVGEMFPLDANFAVGFYENPKIVDLKTGAITYRWEDIATDKTNSSIQTFDGDFSHIAVDKKNKRFAVATPENIEVMVFA